MVRGFFFNNARCTGCRTCVMACKDYHDHGIGQAFRKVIDYEGGGCSVGLDGACTTDAFAYHISISCNHCSNPVCVRVCPTGAMHRDDLGFIWPDAEKCIGCGYCVMACPYHAPSIDPVLKRSNKCDGCTARVRDGKSPICVEACPLRALGTVDVAEASSGHSGLLQSIMPLPSPEATNPNLLIAPSPAALLAEDGRGSVSNREELQL